METRRWCWRGSFTGTEAPAHAGRTLGVLAFVAGATRKYPGTVHEKSRGFHSLVEPRGPPSSPRSYDVQDVDGQGDHEGQEAPLLLVRGDHMQRRGLQPAVSPATERERSDTALRHAPRKHLDRQPPTVISSIRR